MPVSQIRSFTCTFQPGSTPAAPVVVQCQFPVFQVDWIEVDVPDGPSGAMGFYIATSRQQYIPWNVGTYFVFNDVNKHWDLEDQPTSGDWQVYGYNTGTWPHTVYVHFGLEVVPLPEAPNTSSLILPNSVLSS